MPTHVHLLVYPLDPAVRIGSVLFTIKQSVAKRAIRWTREHAPKHLHVFEDRTQEGLITLRFWQRGAGYDRNLTDPSAIRSEIEYIHANPVKAGMCARPEDWVWSSAREHACPGATGVPIDFETLRPAIA